MTGELIGQLLDGVGVFLAHHIDRVVIGKNRHALSVGGRMGAQLEKHRRGVARSAGVDGAADEVAGVELGLELGTTTLGRSVSSGHHAVDFLTFGYTR